MSNAAEKPGANGTKNRPLNLAMWRSLLTLARICSVVLGNKTCLECVLKRRTGESKYRQMNFATKRTVYG